MGGAALRAGKPALPPETLFALPGRLRERQSIFSSTGGLHAAGARVVVTADCGTANERELTVAAASQFADLV